MKLEEILKQNNELIFISIASYRDSQLVPTVEDLIAKADEPGLLRFGICWQHGDEETSLPFAGDERFRVMDVPWHESQGACWARAQAMTLWRGEQWYLQIDSHCRFVHRWDTKLVRMAAETGSAKPILTTYGNAFTPATGDGEQVENLSGPPHIVALDTFANDGLPRLKPVPIFDYAERKKPMAGRFLAAGFLFAPGSFVVEVPYDPELYFLGEEVSMTLRAYTSGYDIFHPVETMTWHDYVRSYAVRHWDDHDGKPVSPVRTATWGELDGRSRARVRHLFRDQSPGVEDAFAVESIERFDLGRFDLGTARSLAEYETYAGVSFRLRKMQDYTRLALEPPNPPAPADWPDRIYTWLVRIRLETADLSPLAFDEFGFWLLTVMDENHQEIRRHDLTKDELRSFTGEEAQVVLVNEIHSGIVPAFWVVWPFSRERGWGRKLEGAFAEDDYSIITDDEEDDVSGDEAVGGLLGPKPVIP